MSADRIVIGIMALFALLGALDRIFGNRFGLGKEFEEGILAMGSLAIAMLGIIALAPVLAGLLKPVIVPVFSFLVQTRPCSPEVFWPAIWGAVHWPGN